MALQNGVLVHGPTSWGCAVRGADGALHIASGRKPHFAPAARQRMPVLRGPVALAEAFALLPTVRRALPQARFPFERPSVLGAILGTAVAARALRRSRLSAGVREIAAAGVAILPVRTRAARAGSRGLPRSGAHLYRHVRERRRACAEGAPALRISAHRANGRLVSCRQRRRVEGPREHTFSRAPRRHCGRDRRLDRGLFVGRTQSRASPRARPHAPRLRASASPLHCGAVGRSARRRERSARRVSHAGTYRRIAAIALLVRCR